MSSGKPLRRPGPLSGLRKFLEGKDDGDEQGGAVAPLPEDLCEAAASASPDLLAAAIDAVASLGPRGAPDAVLMHLAASLNAAELGRGARIGALTALCKVSKIRRFRDAVFAALSVVDEGFEKALADREAAHAESGSALGKYHELMLVTLARARDYSLGAAHVLEMMNNDATLAVEVVGGTLSGAHYEDEVIAVCCELLAELTDPKTYFSDHEDGEYAIDDPRVLEPFCDRATSILQAAKRFRLFDLATESLRYRLFEYRRPPRMRGFGSRDDLVKAAQEVEASPRASGGAGGASSRESKGDDGGGGGKRGEGNEAEEVASDGLLLPERWRSDASTAVKRAGVDLLRVVRNLYLFGGNGEAVLYRLLSFSELIPRFAVPFLAACAGELRVAPEGGRAALLREGVSLALKVLSIATFRSRTHRGMLERRNPTLRLLACSSLTRDAKAVALIAVFNASINAVADGKGTEVIKALRDAARRLRPAQRRAMRDAMVGRGWLPIAKSHESYEVLAAALSERDLGGASPSLPPSESKAAPQPSAAAQKSRFLAHAAPSEWYGAEVPADFMCALSGAVMREPVFSRSAAARIAASGGDGAPRYERAAAEAWVARGADAPPCPVSGVMLRSEALVPDKALAHRITLWHVATAVAANEHALEDEDELYDF